MNWLAPQNEPAMGRRDVLRLAGTGVHNWSKDSWAFGCERHPFGLGTLKKIWPHITQPVRRIHFAGSFADNLPWGMDAATRSAKRVAEVVHQL